MPVHQDPGAQKFFLVSCLSLTGHRTLGKFHPAWTGLLTSWNYNSYRAKPHVPGKSFSAGGGSLTRLGQITVVPACAGEPTSLMEYFNYPVCGGMVKGSADSCPHCGADEETGWSQDVVEEDEFDYDDFLRRDFGEQAESPGKGDWRRILFFLVILVILAFFFARYVL